MPSLISLIQSTVLGLASVGLVKAQYIPDTPSEIVREFQHLYLDAGSASLLTAVTPCSVYTDPSTGQVIKTNGQQSSAQWIRTAFHDFVTQDANQDGGLDASIGFETNRAENVGTAFNDSLTRFSYYFSQRVSMADMIAFGVATATKACGGPAVPFRAGRVDATQAGPSGVPKPEDSVSTTLADFENTYFNTGDIITLTACGHTLGGVHYSSFPDVVPKSAVTSTNTDGRQTFDETVAGFDVQNLNDYVHGTGLKGGPLVTTSNVTTRSDLRLFSYDQNYTVKSLTQSNTYFQEQCADIFQRMIEIVPNSVQFTDFIQPTTSNNLQPYGVYLSIDWKGNMYMTGYFRYVQVSGAPAAPTSLSITLVNRAGKTTTTTVKATASSSDTGSGLFGPTKSYSFLLKFPATVGVSALKANGQTFAFQDTMFAAAGLSSVSPTPPPFSTDGASTGAVANYKVNTTVAYYPGKNTAPTTLTATFAVPVSQAGTVSPKIDTSTTTTLKKIGTSGPYTLYSATTSKSLSAKAAYGVSMDVAVPGQAAGLTYFKPFIANE